MDTIFHGVFRISFRCMGGECEFPSPALDTSHLVYSAIVPIVKLCIITFRADFHDYHHRLLYTKSGNYSSTFTYMDW